MKVVKIVALIAALTVAVVVVYQLLVFGKQAGEVLLATLRSAERTAQYNEQVAANLAATKPGDRLVAIDANLRSVLYETTLTMQALRPAIAETTATTRTARLALAETAGAAKAAREAIAGAKVPDVEPLLQHTNELLGETTRLVRDTDASAPKLLAASQHLVDRLDTLVTDSDLTATLRTTGRIAAHIEHDQDNISTIIANTVPVTEAVKNESAVVERKLGLVRRFFKAIADLF